MDKSSSAKCLLYGDVVKGGSQVPQEGDEEEAVTKKAIKELEIFVSQIFYNFFLFISFFQLLYFITFFLYFFYPRLLPTPTLTTHTHDPRPTTFSYTPGSLTLHLSISYVSSESSKPSVECVCSRQYLFQ